MAGSYDAKKARIFCAAYEKFYAIQENDDLVKNNISLSDCGTIKEFLKEFSNLPDYWLCCMTPAVAAWFRDNGFRVKNPDRENINYRISII